MCRYVRSFRFTFVRFYSYFIYVNFVGFEFIFILHKYEKLSDFVHFKLNFLSNKSLLVLIQLISDVAIEKLRIIIVFTGSLHVVNNFTHSPLKYLGRL